MNPTVRERNYPRGNWDQPLDPYRAGITSGLAIPVTTERRSKTEIHTDLKSQTERVPIRRVTVSHVERVLIHGKFDP